MRFSLTRFLNTRAFDRLRASSTIYLVFLGPFLAFVTYVVLGPFDLRAQSRLLQLVLLADLIYVITIVAFVILRILRIISQRRQRSAGSQLHLRLTGFFTVMALLPTIGVAIFATFTVNMGLEAWFSDRVQSVIGASRSAAEAYETEQRQAMVEDITDLANELGNFRKSRFGVDSSEFRTHLAKLQQEMQRGMKEAFVIDDKGKIKLRGFRNYAFDYDEPEPSLFDAALNQVQIIEDWDNNEIRALVYIDGFPGHYLYVTRLVDGNLLNLLDDTQETASLYQQLENEKGKVLFNFALVYLAFAILMIVSSVLLGLWFAERLSRPIGRLTGAAQKIAEGELNVRVREESGDDEIAQLSKLFNRMTVQLKIQRDKLLQNTSQIDERRRLFDSVLASVTSGVIGLNPSGKISFINRSAISLLSCDHKNLENTKLDILVPEFAPVYTALFANNLKSFQQEIKLLRAGRLENLLVRMAPMKDEDDNIDGFVVAFDDVTQLVSAQRAAAWGDVAQRIAHEIKNPLTPIRLSAERIKRKFMPLVDREGDTLANMTEVIVRQTNDLSRIVDEFSKFARMPEPEKQSEDIIKVVNSAISLQESGFPEILFKRNIVKGPIMFELDATMISQVLINLLKNAGESIESRQSKEESSEVKGQIDIIVARHDTFLEVSVVDNGIGLPADRARLFEPYVTTRENGTGLGLAIVKKIIEEHGGTFRLEDAPNYKNSRKVGAAAIIELPYFAMSEN
ncbi:MAG: ATP-binding protein [Paracoccaceae bacterium]|uniref:sensor histidine kinase NtrY-like n=1 Tax=Candidatus Salinivivens marinus TaxID=3381703 RepID=UPI000BE129F4|nr:MAG: PAS domain-containing sensor histidine kinase [Rhodobacteraceae bacterium MED-G08]